MFFKKYWDRFGLMIANNYAVINSHFSRKDLFKHLAKIFSPAHSFGDWRKNLQYLLRKHSYISVLDNPHLPHSFKKSYFEKLWDMEPEICAETSQSKFRKPTDITSWLVRDLQLMEGSFTPVSRKSRGKYFSLESATAEKIATRMKKPYKMICINDGYSSYEQFEGDKKVLTEAFARKLPNKSSFEK